MQVGPAPGVPIMQQLEQDIKFWADSRWPTRTLASRLRKLGEEVGELSEAVCDYTREHAIAECEASEYNSPMRVDGHHAAQEAADCAIILSDICSMLGYSLSAMMREKFAEVQARPVKVETDSAYGQFGNLALVHRPTCEIGVCREPANIPGVCYDHCVVCRHQGCNEPADPRTGLCWGHRLL